MWSPTGDSPWSYPLHSVHCRLGSGGNKEAAGSIYNEVCRRHKRSKSYRKRDGQRQIAASSGLSGRMGRQMGHGIQHCKMHVGRNNREYDYTMRGARLGKTDEEKGIGVTITKNLKPTVQCENAAGRTTSVLNQIR